MEPTGMACNGSSSELTPPDVLHALQGEIRTRFTMCGRSNAEFWGEQPLMTQTVRDAPDNE